MANRTIKGIRWKRGQVASKGPPIEHVSVASNYGSAIYVGFPVKRLDTGYVDIAAAGEDVYGIVQAIMPYWDAARSRMSYPGMSSPKYLPANVVYGSNLERESKLAIIPVVGQVFEIDLNAAVTAATRAGLLALVGSNADHVISSDDCALNLSDLETKDGSPGSAQWTVTGLSEYVNDDFTASRLKVEVICNEVQFHANESGL